MKNAVPSSVAPPDAQPAVPNSPPPAPGPAEETFRRTTTVDALLGLLSLGPMTGYEIRQLIADSIGNFWTESYGQIYPALKTLVQDGFAELEERTDEGRPLRKVYRLTDQGRDRLIAWLATPARTQVPRNEFLLKIFFGVGQGPRRTADQIRGFREEQQQLYRRYLAIERSLEDQANDPAMPYWRLTVRYGLHHTEALLRWAEASLVELAELGS